MNAELVDSERWVVSAFEAYERQKLPSVEAAVIVPLEKIRQSKKTAGMLLAAG